MEPIKIKRLRLATAANRTCPACLTHDSLRLTRLGTGHWEVACKMVTCDFVKTYVFERVKGLDSTASV